MVAYGGMLDPAFTHETRFVPKKKLNGPLGDAALQIQWMIIIIVLLPWMLHFYLYKCVGIPFSINST